MISFKQFILEDKDFDLDQFKKDCSFILNELKGTGGHYLLYHGTKNWPNGDFDVRSFTPRTKPKDSSVSLHNALNSFFQKKFGAPVRNWLFATGDSLIARIYGSGSDGTLVIFPIGKFEWVCSLDKDAADMTEWHSRTSVGLMDNGQKLSYDARHKMAIDIMLAKMNHMSWKHNEDLVECIKSKHEIMIKCDKFYAFKLLGDVYQDTVKPFLDTI